MKISSEQLKQLFELDGYKMTNDPFRAIFIFPDGQMVDGEYEYKTIPKSGDVVNEFSRKVPHSSIDCLRHIPEYWHDNSKNTWQLARYVANPVLIVPENGYMVTWDTRTLTDKQRELMQILIDAGYRVISNENLDGRYW